MALFKKNFLIILGLTALLLPFQNCSQINFESDSPSSSKSKKNPAPLQGNGTGYGGKVYVSKWWTNGLCTDGSTIKSRFVTINETSASLERLDCLDISATLIDLSEPNVSKHYSELQENPFDLYLYDQRIFETDMPVTPLRPAEVMFVCTGPGNLKFVLKEGFDEAYNPHYVATLSQDGTELLMDLDKAPNFPNGKSFSGSTGSAVYTFDAINGTETCTVTYNSPSVSINSNLDCVSAW